jgi:hypothetical protein
MSGMYSSVYARSSMSLVGLNRTRLVPLLWASEGFDEPNPWLVDNVRYEVCIRVVVGVCIGVQKDPPDAPALGQRGL